MKLQGQVTEVRGRSDEQCAAIETLAGKVAATGSQVAELEKRIAANATVRDVVPPEMIRRVWLGAFAVAFGVVALVAVAGWTWLGR